MARTLILGAGGFVGRAIIQAAAARPDMHAVACLRRPSPELSRAGIETMVLDATDPAAVAHAFEGATYAVNCVLGNPATMVSATRNLCEAARRSGLRRILHLSSMEVYGPAIGVIDETTPVNVRPIGAYARAKAECEAVIRDFVAAGGDAIVIRPGCVYGPGGEQWVGRIGRWLQAGRVGDLGEFGNGFCNLTYNADLAGAVVSALTAQLVAGEAFNLADLEPGTWNQYFAQLAQAIDVPIRRISRVRMYLEATVLAPPLQMAKITARRFGLDPRFMPEPIIPSVARLMRLRLRLDSRKADSMLQFSRTPPVLGLARSATWFRSAAADADLTSGGPRVPHRPQTGDEIRSAGTDAARR